LYSISLSEVEQIHSYQTLTLLNWRKSAKIIMVLRLLSCKLFLFGPMHSIVNSIKPVRLSAGRAKDQTVYGVNNRPSGIVALCTLCEDMPSIWLWQ
jgi:hypothetical protein